MTDQLITGIGWIGVGCTLIAYMLLNIRVFKPGSVTYQLLNIIGGLCLTISAIHFRDPPNMVVNLLWMALGFFGLVRYQKKDPPTAR